MKKLVAVLFLMIIFSGCSSTNDVSTNDNSKNGGESLADNISIENIVFLNKGSSDSLTILGEVKNGNTEACSVSAEMRFYDEDDKLLETAKGEIGRAHV